MKEILYLLYVWTKHHTYEIVAITKTKQAIEIHYETIVNKGSVLDERTKQYLNTQGCEMCIEEVELENGLIVSTQRENRNPAR